MAGLKVIVNFPVTAEAVRKALIHMALPADDNEDRQDAITRIVDDHIPPLLQACAYGEFEAIDIDSMHDLIRDLQCVLFGASLPGDIEFEWVHNLHGSSGGKAYGVWWPNTHLIQMDPAKRSLHSILGTLAHELCHALITNAQHGEQHDIEYRSHAYLWQKLAKGVEDTSAGLLGLQINLERDIGALGDFRRTGLMLEEEEIDELFDEVNAEALRCSL